MPNSTTHPVTYRILCTSDRPLRFQPVDLSAPQASVHRQPYLFWAARASTAGRQAASATEPDAAQPADLRHPPLRHPVSGDRGRHALLLREREYLLRGVEDLLGPGLGPLEAEAVELVGDLDHASRVDQVVGRVDDAMLLEQLLHAWVGELVVRSAADHPGPQGRYGLGIDRAAERA